MAGNEEKIVEEYIGKMIQVQRNRENAPLSLEELKEVALSVGMSELDWRASQEQCANHIEVGKEHLRQNNFPKAIQELEGAVALNPYHVEALSGLCLAYSRRYAESGEISDYDASINYGERTLRIDGDHQPTLSAMAALERSRRKHQARSGQLRKYLLMGAGAVVAVFALLYFYAQSSVGSARESVRAQWAQVENAYQRRADLIPNLVSTVKAGADFEQERLDQLLSAQKNLQIPSAEELNDAKLQSFLQAQSELSSSISEALAVVQRNDKSIFRDLMVQIEGSQNRISVERRKYNQAVQSYNETIKGFPNSLAGGEAMPYLKVDKAAMENPEVNFD